MMKPYMVDYKKRAFREARRNSLDLVSLVKPDLIAQASQHLDDLENGSSNHDLEESNRDDKAPVANAQRVE